MKPRKRSGYHRVQPLLICGSWLHLSSTGRAIHKATQQDVRTDINTFECQEVRIYGSTTCSSLEVQRQSRCLPLVGLRSPRDWVLIHMVTDPRSMTRNSTRLLDHDCSVATCTTVPRPRQPVPAPASCDDSFGISESTLQMKFGSVSGIRSSRRGRACDEREKPGQGGGIRGGLT